MWNITADFQFVVEMFKVSTIGSDYDPVIVPAPSRQSFAAIDSCRSCYSGASIGFRMSVITKVIHRGACTEAARANVCYQEKVADRTRYQRQSQESSLKASRFTRLVAMLWLHDLLLLSLSHRNRGCKDKRRALHRATPEGATWAQQYILLHIQKKSSFRCTVLGGTAPLYQHVIKLLSIENDWKEVHLALRFGLGFLRPNCWCS